MPVKAMTEDEQTTAINLLEPDLGAVFEENRVRRDVQAALATMDVVDCKTFARIEETSTALRVWLHDDVGLERNGADKIVVAKVVAAWEAAQTRTRALQTQEAEERSAGLPASITGGAFIAARRAWEENPAANLAMGQSLSAAELPAKSYLEWRFAQVDDGEFLAEALAEVASQQEEAQQVDDTTQADFVQQGNKAVMRLRRARAKSAMPITTEQLRHKYRLMAVHWGMFTTRYPNKSWAAKYSPQTFRDRVDWLLGENVAELKAVNPQGNESVRPTWSVVLRYELELRKEATRRMNLAGSTIADALHLARLSDDIRTRYLITPLALGGQGTQQEEVPRPLAVKASFPKKATQPKKRAGPRNQTERQQQPKKKRRQGNDNRNSRVRREDSDALHNTHNGKSICYAFQRPKGCSRGAECLHQHICAHCIGPHSFEKCNQYKKM